MRTLSSLSLLATLCACGTATTESGNVFVTEQALETVGGVETGVGAQTVKVVPVQIDESDPGCSVDGLRFSRCPIAAHDPSDAFAGPNNLCEMQIGTRQRTLVDCEVRKSFENGLEPIAELPVHCPSGF